MVQDKESNKRLSKALAASGVASRRACEELILGGKVKVNGAVVLAPQTMVDLASDVVTVNGEQIGGEQQKVYYVLHKPVGYVCTQARRGSERLVLDLFGGSTERLFTVGRLDKNTAGLILVTNDGDFANRIMHPSASITKEYVAKANLDITHEHLVDISSGTFVDGALVTPISVKKVRKRTLKIVVGEGRKHEVRLLLEAAGLKVIELTRVRIGGLTLGKIPVGAYRTLTAGEKKAIFGGE